MSAINNPAAVGGNGGNYYSTGAVAKVKSVTLRSGKYIDSITVQIKQVMPMEVREDMLTISMQMEMK